jgi:hypothetical protein
LREVSRWFSLNQYCTVDAVVADGEVLDFEYQPI